MPRRPRESFTKGTSQKTKDTKLNDVVTLRKNIVNVVGLDVLDLQILSEMLLNSDIKSIDISNKLKIPLSTIQRRRSKIEKSSMLKRAYEIDYKQLGLRRADLMVDVSKGDYVDIVKIIVKEYRENVLEAYLTIGDPYTNLVVKVVYTDSDELFDMMQYIRKMEYVDDVRWSEFIKVVVKNNSGIAEKLISKPH